MDGNFKARLRGPLILSVVDISEMMRASVILSPSLSHCHPFASLPCHPFALPPCHPFALPLCHPERSEGSALILSSHSSQLRAGSERSDSSSEASAKEEGSAPFRSSDTEPLRTGSA